MKLKKLVLSMTSFLLLFFLTISIKANSTDDYPITNYVNDYVDVLSDSQERQLNDLGRNLENQSGAQVVFVIVNTLNGDDVFDISYEMGTQTGVGSSEKDTGLLCLISIDDREYFTQVGYGLEGILPDIRVADLQKDILVPNFRTGNYAKGITELYDQYINIIEDNLDEVGVAPKDNGYDYDYDSQSSFIDFLIPMGFFGFVAYAIYAFAFKNDNSEKSHSLVIQVGQDYRLKVPGYDFERESIILSSSDPDIVSVKPNGWIHGNRIGTAVINLQKTNASQIYRIRIQVSSGGYSNRQNDDILDGIILGSMLNRRRGYPYHHRGGFGSGGFGGGFGGGSGGFRGGGGGFGGGGAGGKW